MSPAAGGRDRSHVRVIYNMIVSPAAVFLSLPASHCLCTVVVVVVLY